MAIGISSGEARILHIGRRRLHDYRACTIGGRAHLDKSLLFPSTETTYRSPGGNSRYNHELACIDNRLDLRTCLIPWQAPSYPSLAAFRNRSPFRLCGAKPISACLSPLEGADTPRLAQPAAAITSRCRLPFTGRKVLAQRTAAVTTTSIFQSGLASFACIVARGGA